MRIGVDIDDVLIAVMEQLIAYMNYHQGTRFTTATLPSYCFWESWPLSRDEAIAQVHAFYMTSAFKGARAVHGAQQGIASLVGMGHELIAITARPQFIEPVTRGSLAFYFPGAISRTEFCNTYVLEEGRTRTKSRVCQELGIDQMIDDAFHNTVECAQAGIPTILFTNAESYAWNHGKEAEGVTPCATWDDIVAYFR